MKISEEIAVALGRTSEALVVRALLEVKKVEPSMFDEIVHVSAFAQTSFILAEQLDNGLKVDIVLTQLLKRKALGLQVKTSAKSARGHARKHPEVPVIATKLERDEDPEDPQVVGRIAAELYPLLCSVPATQWSEELFELAQQLVLTPS